MLKWQAVFLTFLYFWYNSTLVDGKINLKIYEPDFRFDFNIVCIENEA